MALVVHAGFFNGVSLLNIHCEPGETDLVVELIG